MNNRPDHPAGQSLNQQWAQRDVKHVWHPCSQMKDHEWLPLIPIKRGEGVWLEDFDGNRYIDAVSSWWVNIHGHSHPAMNAAIKAQVDQLEHVILGGFTHQPVVELSEQLCELAGPPFSKVFYADNGSAGIEVAVKMSFHYWKNLGRSGKKNIVKLSNSYHGETLGALAVGDVELYKDIYQPLLIETLTAPSPDCYSRDPDDSWETHSRKKFAEMETLLAERGDDIAAVIVEPLVQCAGSMRMYHPVYLELLRAACDRYEVHLIADEMAVGFGRTGTMFACEQANIQPDFLCLSKGLTGGYLPLAAIVTHDTIYDAFYDDYATMKAFLHSHSYTGNPLACAAGLASMELFRQNDILQNNQRLIAHMDKVFTPFAEHPNVAEVRQTGMIVAIELVQNKATREPFPWQERRGLRVFEYGLKNGALLRPLGNVVYLMPPYVITTEQIDQLAKVMLAGIELAVK